MAIAPLHAGLAGMAGGNLESCHFDRSSAQRRGADNLVLTLAPDHGAPFAPVVMTRGWPGPASTLCHGRGVNNDCLMV